MSPDFVADPTLPDTVQRLLTYLEAHTRRCYDACLLATKTIAEALGWSVRKTQLALRAATARGLVLVVRTWRWASQHEIRLLWRDRQPGPLFRDSLKDPSVSANPSAGPAQPFAPADACPPIRSEDEGVKKTDDDTGEPESSSSQVPLTSPEPETTVSPAEVERLAQEAATALNLAAPPTGRVAQAVKQTSPEWVRRALEIAKAKGARGWGYVLGILRNWQAEGGPQDAAAESAAEERKRRETEACRRFQAMQYARIERENLRKLGYDV